MQDWQKYVSKEKRQEFKKKFTEIVMTKIDGMLDEACYFGTHHSMYDCPFKGDEEECPELCWDDSDDRDIKDNTAYFYGRLWTDTFKFLNIEPQRKRKRDDKDEDDEDEDGEDGKDGEEKEVEEDEAEEEEK